MPTSEWRARRDDLPRLSTDVRQTLTTWHVTSAFVDMWLRSATERVAADAEARVTVDFDEDIHLLSFDVWVDGRRVYGADDFVL